MSANLSFFLSSKDNHEPLPVTLGLNFLRSQWKSTSIFIALISFSSLANADCSEDFAIKLLDRKYSLTQITKFCGKITGQPSAGGTNTGVANVAAEVKPAADTKVSADAKPASETKPATETKAEADTKAAEVAKSLKQGEIKNIRNSPADLSGRRVKLNQDDSQYHAFIKVKGSPKDKDEDGKICGMNCEYRIKNDINDNLTVNIIAKGDKGDVEDHKDYTIPKLTHESLEYAYRGLTFGALVVPFK